MKIIISKPEYLSSEGLKTLLLRGGPHSKFIGSWAVKTRDGGWSDYPIDIVYTSNIDTSLVLSGYWRDPFTSESYKSNALTSFYEDNIMSCILEDDIVYTSKFRHDFVKTPSGSFIDGGRDYCRTNSIDIRTLRFDTVNGKFMIGNKDNTHFSEVEIEYDFN